MVVVGFLTLAWDPSVGVSAVAEAGEAPPTAAELASCEPGFWLNGAPSVGAH